MPAIATAEGTARPLCVDLDGTLVTTDLLWESFILTLRRQPLTVLQLPLWLLRGKAYLKRRLCAVAVPDARTLPYREDVLALLRAQQAAGRPLVLATAADRSIADAVAAHLGCFSAVLASDGQRNLAGAAKLAAVRQHCGADAFDYIGNSAADLPLWAAAQESILVEPPAARVERATRPGTVRHILRSPRRPLATLVRALRMHQWAKNGLLFLPLVLSHQLFDLALFGRAVAAFVAFSLCASAVYIMNDLLDLEADRAHPHKRLRPFAAGALQIPTGLALLPVLLGLGLGTSLALLPPEFTLTLVGYLLLTSAYSLYLKAKLLLDVFLLAGLYTLRVLAGGVATGIAISPWLAAFSMFFFTSLAFLKRYSELRLLQEQQVRRSRRRDYSVADMDLLRSAGTASAYAAVLVLALYTNSPEVLELYARPQALWLILPIVLYWTTRIWFLADRGRVPDDPIVFTARDRMSYISAAVIGVLMLVSTW